MANGGVRYSRTQVLDHSRRIHELAASFSLQHSSVGGLWQRKRPFHLGKGPTTDYRSKRSPGAGERERPGQRQGHFI